MLFYYSGSKLLLRIQNSYSGPKVIILDPKFLLWMQGFLLWIWSG